MRDWDDEEFEFPSFLRHDEILAILRSADDERRLEVLGDMSEVEDELALELLGLVVSQEPEEVRAAAAIALGPTLAACDLELEDDGLLTVGEYGAPLTQATYDRVVEGLERVYRDPAAPTLVRRRALEAAVRSPREWQAAAIRAAWAGQDPAWRLTAVFCMGEYHLVDFSTEVRAALLSNETELRGEAMLAAGHLGLEGVVEVAEAVALDENEPTDLRLAAMASLAFTGSPDAEPPLLRLVEHRDRGLAEAAESALEELALRQQLEAFDDDEYGSFDGDDD